MTSKWIKDPPSHEKILEAFLLEKPQDSTDEQKEAMNMLLNVVLPSIDPNLVKKWIPTRTTHLRHFGKTYIYDMALAFNLTSMFSDLANVLHNAGIVDGQGNLRPENSDPPAKKRRKKTVTKSMTKPIETDYYKHIATVRDEFNKPGFAARMEWWDRTLCDKRNELKEGTIHAANRQSTMDPAMENNTDDIEEFTLRDFFRSSSLFQITNADSSSSVSSSESPNNNLSTQPVTEV